jgi:hypothetical protein
MADLMNRRDRLADMIGERFLKRVMTDTGDNTATVYAWFALFVLVGVGVFIGFLFLAQYLWNEVFVKLFVFVRPMTTVWYVVGLVAAVTVLLWVIRPSSMALF